MSYPTQGKGQQPPAGYPPQYSQMPQAPPASGAPPPYSTIMYGQGNPVHMYPHQQQYTFAQAQAPGYVTNLPGPPMGGPPPNPYMYQPQQMHNPGYPVQMGGPVQSGYPTQATAQYDSGARFDGIASQTIPPPPPGIAPNSAQMAAAQGGTVFATQKKDNWFTGGKGGGMTFW